MFDFTTDVNLKGKWSLNDENVKESWLFGILIYDKNKGLSLRIEGSLYDTKSIHHARHNFEISIIYGITEDRRYITLLNAFGSELGSSEWIYTEMDIEYALICSETYFAHLDMGIHLLNFNLNSLSSFLSGTESKLYISDHTDRSLKLSYDQPQEISVFNNNDIEVYFYFSYSFKGISSLEGFQFRNEPYINFKFLTPTEIFQSFKNLRSYKDFFTFFTHRRVAYRSANIFSRNEKNELIRFNVLFKNDATEVGGTIYTFDTVLHYNELEDIFPKMIETWLTKQATINSGLSLFMQTKYFLFPSSIQSFLNLVFATETLHNSYFFSRRLIFKEMLKDLINRIYPLIEKYIYDVEDFSDRVKRQRNYLAHDHSLISNVAISDNNYPYFISSLKMIFECTFLRILGLDDDRIKDYLRKHSLYERNPYIALKLREELT